MLCGLGVWQDKCLEYSGVRAFDYLFYNRNCIRSWCDPTEHVGNREHVWWSLVDTESEPFRMRFAYFSHSIPRIQYKSVKIGGQIAVNLRICHHFYILTLKG